MKHMAFKVMVILAAIALVAGAAEKVYKWEVHDMSRPVPPVITPGAENFIPPSDAIVLFDGKDLSAWQSSGDGSPAKWKVENGYMEVTNKGGEIRTKQTFGSCQLHIEFCTPAEVKGDSQGRGNSGVFLMGKYELQVLDSFNNPTYADGQCGAIYGQKPPLVNVCRQPGQWQAYDVIFHAPVFKGDVVEKPATITVLQNGVLVQDNWQIEGTTFHKVRSKYEPHDPTGPLCLQDHGNPMRFRNVWIRELKENTEQ